MSAKQTLRGIMRSELGNMTIPERRAASEAIVERACTLATYASAHTVLCFCSNAREVNTAQLILRMMSQGKIVFLPRVIGEGRMEAALSDGRLQSGAYGLMEPVSDVVIEPGQIDLVWTPGMAFDRNGGRLGHGGGYYDQYLACVKGCAAGLAFEKQMVDEIPREPYDVRVAYVVTERAIYKAGV